MELSVDQHPRPLIEIAIAVAAAGKLLALVADFALRFLTPRTNRRAFSRGIRDTTQRLPGRLADIASFALIMTGLERNSRSRR